MTSFSCWTTKRERERERNKNKLAHLNELKQHNNMKQKKISNKIMYTGNLIKEILIKSGIQKQCEKTDTQENFNTNLT